MRNHALRPEVQRRIFLFFLRNPNMAMTEIAAKFRVTYNQVLYSIQKGKRGGFGQPAPSMYRTRKVRLEDIETKSEKELIEDIYLDCIKELHIESQLSPSTKIPLLEKLANIKKIIQHTTLENHLKRADAEIIARIIRRYEPEATNEDVIRIYREEYEKWQVLD